MGRFVDLSHEITAGMVTYPGLPGPVIEDHLSFADSRAHYATGIEFRIGRIELVANTGTYLDTPAHRYRDGFDLADLSLAAVAGVPGLVVDGPPSGPVAPELFAGLPLAGRAVLIRTGWDRHWVTPEYASTEHPYLPAATARDLVDAGVQLVGIDAINVDDTSAESAGDRPAHSILLAAGIPIVEHLCNLNGLDAGRAFSFYAVPVKIRDLTSFPVRAFVQYAED